MEPAAITTAVSVFALLVSVASACFAGFGWRTNHQKLRLDLYNRRFDVYSRTLDFYHALQEWEPTDVEKTTTSLHDSPELRATQRAFIKAKEEARFLFDDDAGIHGQLEQMHKDTIGIIGYKRDYAPKLGGQTQMIIAAHAEFTERLNRINDAIPALQKALSDYLDFHAVGQAGKMW